MSASCAAQMAPFGSQLDVRRNITTYENAIHITDGIAMDCETIGKGVTKGIVSVLIANVYVEIQQS